MRSILDYVSHGDRTLWVVAHVLAAVSLLFGAGVWNSWFLAALGCSASVLMAWPTYRALIPVGYAVIIQGHWPQRGEGQEKQNGN